MANYDCVRKRTKSRDLLLLQYHLDNPDLSLKEIGATFGITKQRVHQLLKKASENAPAPGEIDG